MVAAANSIPQDKIGTASKIALAALIKVASKHPDPDRRHDALERLVAEMPGPAMVKFLIGRIRQDRDMPILSQCVGWLLGPYFERRGAEKAILDRLEREPDPELRHDILRMADSWLGTSDPVLRTVARLAENDPEPSLRIQAAETLAELERLRFDPPAPAPVSHSTRLLTDRPTVTFRRPQY